MMTLLIIPIVALLGMATEASGWFLTQRAAQNAADSAAIAAAINACGATASGASDPTAACHKTPLFQPTFDQEAASVATGYGFTDGVANTTVNTVTNPCPADATQTCYWVTIKRKVPIYLVELVGFNGDTTVGTSSAQTVSSLAVASAKQTPAPLCLTALSTGTGITTHGTGASFSGCPVGTNGQASCNQNQGAVSTVATNSGALCGGPVSTQSLTDPYAPLASNIPATSCSAGSAQTIGAKNSTTTLTLSSTPIVYCNGVSLKGDIHTTGTGVIVVVNGNFDPSGNTFQTGSGSHVTIIFTGTGSSSGMIEPNSKGTVDIEAPQSGTWSGVAVYTNPSQTTTVTYKGNGATATILDITGIVYMPHASLTFDGSFSKATNSSNSCIALVVYDFTGNGNLQKQTDCNPAGVVPPNGGLAVRQALVG